MKDKFGIVFKLKEDSRKNRIIRFLLIIVIIELFTFLGKIGAEYLERDKYMGMLIGFLIPFAVLVGKKLKLNFNSEKVIQILFAISLPIMILLWIGGLEFFSIFFWIAMLVIVIALYLGILVIGAIILAPILITYLIYWTFFNKIELKNDKEKKIEPITNKGLYNSANTDVLKDLKKKYNISNTETDEDEEEEHYCENCFKKISEEEWELNDCMCEDCMTELMLFEMENRKDRHD